MSTMSSTPGSSSSTPYKYAAAQAQDPRYHHPNQANTSSASAYAYQQQQLSASRQSLTSISSTSTVSSYPYLPPQVQRQPRRPSPLADRPHSIEELARIAGQDKYDRYGEIKQDLRYAEVYMAAGKRELAAGDLEWAFVYFARAATLILEKMPANSGYHGMKEAHRNTLSDNGNFCLEKMGELKPKLVDRYEFWRQRNPNTKPELDMPRILSAMAVRDEEELAIRAQANREKRAASKEEAVRRAQIEEMRRRNEEAMKRGEPPPTDYDEEFRRRQEATRLKQAQDFAEKKAYEDTRRQEEARKRETEGTVQTRLIEEASVRGMSEGGVRRNEIERQRREAEEEGRRHREEEIAMRKYEEVKRQELAQRQEQEAASRRKSEELEHRRRLEETRRREQIEEARRREQEGILQRQREAEAEAQASRSMLRVAITAPDSSISSISSSSSSPGSTLRSLTPKQQDALPILPLESPTREGNVDPRDGRHHPKPQHAVPDRAVGRTNSYPPPFTTTSPPPKGRPVAIQYPELMTEHQRQQGYAPSLQSMFSTPIPAPPTNLLFSPNHPEGPSRKNIPSSPDRPPAHIRHMWEQAGYGYQYSQPPTAYAKPKFPVAMDDSRILRPEQVRDEAVTVMGKDLRIVKVPQNILPRFLAVAAVNTARNRETCGLLMGREDGKEYKVSTLLIPKQRATSDTCTMDEEELVSEFSETRSLLTLGWIHTHPTQSCFMSSLDLHTHAAFQCTLPEFFAVVCAPKHLPDCGIFRLTDPPGLKTILKCTNKASFHPHPENPIYTDADKGHVVWEENAPLEIVDLR